MRPSPEVPDSTTTQNIESKHFNTLEDSSIEELDSDFIYVPVRGVDKMLSELTSYREFPENINVEDIGSENKEIIPKKATYRLVVERECDRTHVEKTDQLELNDSKRDPWPQEDIAAETPLDFDNLEDRFGSETKRYLANKTVHECELCSGSEVCDCEECDGQGTIGCEDCNSSGEKMCYICSGQGKKDCSYCNGTMIRSCPNCDGGTYACSNCNGDGNYDCEECGGESEFACSDCGGNGQQDCEQCSGDELVACDNCNGDGEIEKDSETASCPNCNGSGEVGCPKCQGSGSQRCGNCNGSGSIDCKDCDPHGKKKCYECNQRGYKDCKECDGAGEFECTKCDSSGEVECSKCGGEEYLTCSTCSGETHVQCENCDGEGQITCTKCNGEGDLIDYTEIDIEWSENRRNEPSSAPHLDGWQLRDSEVVSENPLPDGDKSVTCFEKEFIYEIPVIVLEYKYDYDLYKAYKIGTDSTILYDELPGDDFEHEYNDSDQGKAGSFSNLTDKPVAIAVIVILLIIVAVFISGGI